MLKNVRLKKLLKSSVFVPLSLLNQILPKRDRQVMFYIATGGIQFNLRPVLDHMLKNGFDRKYHIVCGIEDMKFRGSEKNVEYITKIRAMLRFLTTRHVFYTAGQIPIKPSRRQKVIHLTHGATYYKAMGALSNINNGDEFFFNRMITTGDYFRKIVQKAYRCKAENIAVCDEPVTDEFFRPSAPYDLGEGCEKTVLWMPTFRQSEELGYDNSATKEALVIFQESDYEALNAYLREKKIRLIVKLHPAQDIRNYQLGQYSHLLIYSHKSFLETGYDTYRLLKQADALIGDYSSVSLQYLLLNRPMAFVIPDLEDYQKNRGFVFRNPLQFMPGHIVKTKEEFYRFLDDFAQGKDPYRKQREAVRDTIHKYQDGHACERVLKLSGIQL